MEPRHPKGSRLGPIFWVILPSMTILNQSNRSVNSRKTSAPLGGKPHSFCIPERIIGSSRRIALSMTPRLLALPGSGPLSSCINGLIKHNETGGIQMDPLLRTALWQQFGATIDMLENALLACPSTHWNGRLWSDHSVPEYPAFWSITHHTLFWLDLYLTGSLEGFAPPAPFTLDELDPARVLPEQPYTKDELHAYLVNLRKKCQTTIAGLSDEKAHQQVDFPWVGEKPMSFLELLLYTMRHVQEHAAQLNLFLGQNASDGASDWVSRAKADEGGE